MPDPHLHCQQYRKPTSEYVINNACCNELQYIINEIEIKTKQIKCEEKYIL